MNNKEFSDGLEGVSLNPHLKWGLLIFAHCSKMDYMAVSHIFLF